MSNHFDDIFTYHRIGEGDGSPGIYKHFNEAIDFIRQSKTVLVHCQMGQSRSVTFVCAYLMQENNVNNVHFRGNELTGVIDFYYAATDACLFDLCIAINDWCTRWEQDSVELSTLKYEHFLQGYKSIRPLETIETNNMHTMLQIGAWHFWIYRLYVNLHKKPGSSITMKNPNEFKWMLLERLKEF